MRTIFGLGVSVGVGVLDPPSGRLMSLIVRGPLDPLDWAGGGGGVGAEGGGATTAGEGGAEGPAEEGPDELLPSLSLILRPISRVSRLAAGRQMKATRGWAEWDGRGRQKNELGQDRQRKGQPNGRRMGWPEDSTRRRGSSTRRENEPCLRPPDFDPTVRSERRGGECARATKSQHTGRSLKSTFFSNPLSLNSPTPLFRWCESSECDEEMLSYWCW